MDLLKMITELQDERQRLDEAIEALERLSTGTQGQRRGRPPRVKADGFDAEPQPLSEKAADSTSAPRSKKS